MESILENIKRVICVWDIKATVEQREKYLRDKKKNSIFPLRVSHSCFFVMKFFLVCETQLGPPITTMKFFEHLAC